MAFGSVIFSVYDYSDSDYGAFDISWWTGVGRDMVKRLAGAA